MAPTLTDKLLLLPKLSAVMGLSLASLATGPFRGNDGASTILEHMIQTYLRSLMTYMTYGQLQTLMPPFVDVYKKSCTSLKLEPDVVDIPGTQTKGFWIGDKTNATHTLVYYHGGGFVMPGIPQQLDLLRQMVEWSDGKLAIFCHAYTLAPGAAYPTQIGEGVEALRYILSQPGRSPSNVLIGGDSAGGNLTIAVISHISGHPHPNSDLVKPLEIEGKLRGALAISPWTSSDTRFKSAVEFHSRDVVNRVCANYWIDLYKGGEANPSGQGINDDEYIVPELASEEWWSNSKIDTLLTTLGEHEVLKDAIISWEKKFANGTKGKVSTTVVTGKREIHDGPLGPVPEAELNKLSPNTSSLAAIKSWLKGIVV